MKTLSKKLCSAALSITLITSFFTPAALAFADETVIEPTIVASGSCGLAADGSEDNSVQWTLDSDGSMRIFGKGTLAPTPSNTYQSRWEENKQSILCVTVENGVCFPEDSSSLFNGLWNVARFNLTDTDVTGVKNMWDMFADCESTLVIDLTGWDTSNVTNMGYMFAHCWNLTEIKGINDLDTSRVTNMQGMFSYCNTGLMKLDLSDWNTSTVTDMSYMFTRCWALETLDVTGWDVSNVENIGCMFSECTSLTGIKGINDWDLSSLLITGVEIPNVFYNCSNLKGVEIDDQLYAGQKRLNDLVIANSPKYMYRLYNPNSGEHFYTSSSTERDNLKSLGWHYEGEGWKAPSSGDPVYRLYNPNAGEHHYTTSASERDNLVNAGWNYEGIGWYSDTAKTVPLYRLYNPNEYANNHHYTKSASEKDYLISLGWKYEGEAWYGV